MDAPKKILIVEDDELLRSSLTHRFEEAGYAVVAVHNGEEGVTAFVREKPAAVVTDVMMPRKDGMRMIAEIRTQFPDDHTPFVILSNANDVKIIAKALDYENVAYLLKSDRSAESVVEMISEKLKTA